MLAPEVEDRFRKIEDTLAETAELQRYAESRKDEDLDRLRAIQNAMVDWSERWPSDDDLDGGLKALTDAKPAWKRLWGVLPRLSIAS